MPLLEDKLHVRKVQKGTLLKHNVNCVEISRNYLIAVHGDQIGFSTLIARTAGSNPHGRVLEYVLDVVARPRTWACLRS